MLPSISGVASAMWAYGPALGFGLSSYAAQLWITLGAPPPGITAESSDWLGAWWLGLVVLCVLYLVVGLPFLFYPKTLKRRHLGMVGRDGAGDVELMTLRDLTKANSYVSRKEENTVKWCLGKLAGKIGPSCDCSCQKGCMDFRDPSRDCLPGEEPDVYDFELELGRGSLPVRWIQYIST